MSSTQCLIACRARAARLGILVLPGGLGHCRRTQRDDPKVLLVERSDSHCVMRDNGSRRSPSVAANA